MDSINREIESQGGQTRQGIQTIKIFDFDGTLFRSPNPNAALWDSHTIGRLKADYYSNGYGWYQNVRTLSDEYIDLNGFVDVVASQVEASMNDPHTLTVLLTGRREQFLPQIKRIVARRNLRFDHFGLKPDQLDMSTVNFKLKYIRALLDHYHPTEILMWEDRPAHVKKFEEFLSSLGLRRWGVVHITEGQAVIPDSELERQLVELLRADADKMLGDLRAGRPSGGKKASSGGGGGRKGHGGGAGGGSSTAGSAD